MAKTVSIVVPVFNEEDNINSFLEETNKVIQTLKYKFDFWFIDDGSTDDTLKVVKDAQKKNKNIHYVTFSRNFGKEAALFAGLERSADYDYTIVMDVDLQDPPTLIPQMFKELQEEDLDSVATARSNRQGEAALKSWLSDFFYLLVSKVSKTKIVNGARDFRLMTKQMVNAILSLPENQRFSKGIFTWVGFKTKYIKFPNRERTQGKTKWNFWSLFKYAIEGLISFSTVPLTLVTVLGMLTMFVTFIAGVVIVIRYFLKIPSQFGWSSTVIIIMFFGGLQMFSLGIVGRYIANIYLETKRRPIYIAKEIK
ncbi:MAG: glycosyltransferase family 2 protein [Lactobacillaceae bacterium]|jgi:glycosyltransferase involved in cell wall biosynthesis|nr:glycosyltransferase family 2 protein [Lactobacillaceae bacterium]